MHYLKIVSGILITVSLVVFLPMASCSKSSSEKETSSSKQKGKEVQTITSEEQLNSVVENTKDKLLVFDLYADWCMPCKQLAPVFSSMAEEHQKKATFYRIDVDKNPGLARTFGVRGIPYVVFVKNGEAIYAITGLNPRENYEKVIIACGAGSSSSVCQNQLKNM